MDFSSFTIPYLESLRTGDLISLADTFGLDIPHGLERNFIIEELLYWDREHDDSNGEVEDVARSEFPVTAVLPDHYNFSFIEALPRDPLWIFVFWEVKPHDREQHENTPNFEGYCLRVIPVPEDKSASDSFVVAIGMNDTSRYLGFPPDHGRCFKFELCVQIGENLTVLAVSRPFTLPRLIKTKPASVEMQTVYRNPLAQLSGVEHFSLVHSEDRDLRPRGI